MESLVGENDTGQAAVARLGWRHFVDPTSPTVKGIFVVVGGG